MIPEEIASELYRRSQKAIEIPFSSVKKILSSAASGDDAIDSPKLYRWFVIEKFPTKVLDMDYDEEEKRRYNKIERLLRSGAEEWPVFFSADGLVIDGYHRIVVHRSMGHQYVIAVVAVRKPNTGIPTISVDPSWDELWNEKFPR